MRISEDDQDLIRDVYHTCLRHGPSGWSRQKCWREAHRLVLQSTVQLQGSLRERGPRPGPRTRKKLGLGFVPPELDPREQDVAFIRSRYRQCVRKTSKPMPRCWRDAVSEERLERGNRAVLGPFLYNLGHRLRGSRGLSELERVRLLPVQGYRDGNKAWIDVFPPGGPRMRITHEVLPTLEGLGRALTARARARIPSRKFALPGRRFPIQDCSHARNALSRASMSYHRGNLTRDEHETVVRKARAAMRRHCT